MRVFLYRFFLLGLLVISPVHAEIHEGYPFSDVPSTHPNAEAITYVRTNGIVQGYSDGSFHPDRMINRAEFTKIMVEATGSPYIDEYAQGRCFTDVGNEWFGRYVCYAKAHAIISGYGDGTFHPDQAINLSEAAKIMVNTFLLPQGGVAPSDPWYKRFVEGMEMRQAIPLTVQAFGQKITRGEMAEMVYRLKAGITNKPSQTYDGISLLDHSDWKTYTNGLQGFSFKYPGEWVVIESDENRFVVATTTECGDENGSTEKLMEQYKECDRFTFWTGDPVGATYGDEEYLYHPIVDGQRSDKFIYNIPAQGSVDGQSVYIPVASIGGQVQKDGVWYKYSLKVHQGRITHGLKLFDSIIGTIRFLS